MLAFLKRLCKAIIYPLSWTIISTILLCLPGNSIPGFGLFGVKHLDKIAHIIIFGGIVFSWSMYAWYKPGQDKRWMVMLGLITALSIAFGIAMEFVQFNFIPNREFDTGDIWADIVGSLLATLLSYWAAKKIN